MSRILFIVGFFVLAFLPGLRMLTEAAPSFLNENRNLAPGISFETPVAQIPRVADRWFSDHFGFRSLLIKVKTQVDFSLFKMSDRVLVGKDGQLFYRGTVNVWEPLIDHILAKDEPTAVENFAALTHALRAKGIQVALIVNMMSDRFYPELLPRSIVRRPVPSRMDNFVAKLGATPGVLFVDSTAILHQTMIHRRIFHRTDFHWNDPAAFEVGKVLVDRMNVEEGRPTSNWTHPLVIETERTSGGIAMEMPLFMPPFETSLKVKQTWDWPPGFEISLNQGPFEIITHARPSPTLLPPTVFVGDSFIDGLMRSGLQAKFVETHRIRWSPDVKISTIISCLPTDTKWLVIQFVEIEQPAIRGLLDKADIAESIRMLTRY